MGGIGEVKKIAAQAEANHIAICPHNPSGPVANAACLQLAACTPNFRNPYLTEKFNGTIMILPINDSVNRPSLMAESFLRSPIKKDGRIIMTAESFFGKHRQGTTSIFRSYTLLEHKRSRCLNLQVVFVSSGRHTDV